VRRPRGVLAVIGAKGQEGERIWQERQELLLAWLPNVEPLVLSGATHLLQVEHPHDMAEGLAAFSPPVIRSRVDHLAAKPGPGDRDHSVNGVASRGVDCSPGGSGEPSCSMRPATALQRRHPASEAARICSQDPERFVAGFRAKCRVDRWSWQFGRLRDETPSRLSEWVRDAKVRVAGKCRLSHSRSTRALRSVMPRSSTKPSSTASRSEHPGYFAGRDSFASTRPSRTRSRTCPIRSNRR
jgi:hypothetical protein